MPYPKIPLEPDCSYHVFNHAVGNDDFFCCSDNYYYFLSKVKQWILPVADFYAWCLMSNHFHFVIRIKSAAQLEKLFDAKLRKRLMKHQNPEPEVRTDILTELVTEQFSHCFNAYAQAYNKMYHRMGSLFKGSFQRKKITTELYLKRVVCYVHNNPVHHNVERNISNWRFSSFKELIGNTELMTLKNEVAQLYGGMRNLFEAHNVSLGDEVLLDTYHLNYLTPG